MKLFKMIISSEDLVFTTYQAYQTKKEAIVEGNANGTIEKIDDVTNSCFTDDSPELLKQHLSQAGWGVMETQLLCALLKKHIVDLKR